MSAITDNDWFTVGHAPCEVRLCLRRYVGAGSARGSERPASRRVVLMLHGGNTSSDCFLLPEGGLARYLAEQGLDVWLLDWRSSPYVVEPLLHGEPLGGSQAEERRAYTLDRVVEEDIPESLRRLRSHVGNAPLTLLGHCLGAGVISLATARGKLAGSGVTHLVLSTLGLFYEVPWNGWIKAEDFILERVLDEDPLCRDIDPSDDQRWPQAFRSAYEHWPRAWLPAGTSEEARLLSRLTFMFGQPYAMEALHDSIRGDVLAAQFGPMHLGLYLHMGELVRRGYAAPFGAPDVYDRPRAARSSFPPGLRRSSFPPGVARSSVPPGPPRSSSPPSSGSVIVPGSSRPAPAGQYGVDDLDPEPFLELRKVTLIGAAENQLWHRDAVDRMYEWLRRIHVRGRRVQCEKRVFTGYRLQELLWGKRAKEQTYGAYRAGAE